jgi:hypothetical protein
MSAVAPIGWRGLMPDSVGSGHHEGMKLSATRAQVALPPPAAQAVWRELTQRSIDLHQLYQRALRTSEPGLRTVLKDNAQTLELLIRELQAQDSAGDESHRDHRSWRGAARRRLCSWRVRMMARQDRAWLLRTLAHQGGDLLESFEASIAQLPAESARVLCRQLPRLRGMRQDMQCLVGGPL